MTPLIIQKNILLYFWYRAAHVKKIYWSSELHTFSLDDKHTLIFFFKYILQMYLLCLCTNFTQLNIEKDDEIRFYLRYLYSGTVSQLVT